MIPYGHQSIDDSDINEVIKVLKSNWLTQGPKVLEFEKALAKYCGVKYAIAVSNGTAALHLAYLTAGLKKGDEVMVTPNTFASVVNMLLVVGVKPVFCDIRLDTYNIDESKIEKLITKKTKAIIPLHFAGHSCEMDAIREIAKKNNLIVIEDACHGLGGRYKDKKIGSLANMSILSFHPVKPITTGEGGAILTNNQKYYKKLISLRSHGIYKDKKGKNVMTELGFNYRLTDFQAALGLSQLKKLNKFIQKRRQIAKWYQKELKNIKEIILPVELPDSYAGWHIYVIRTKDSRSRDNLMEYLKKNRVGANFHYPAVYSHPYYQKHGFKNFKFKNEDIYQKSCLTLPCYTQLVRADICYIGKLIKNYFNK
ncbi:UDP-4-amino-4,6-dideoxy-N-acetyl-beta-L-altrosamine transaminase [Patescibacteria group bacterium]|nr:UDP-4-amino-4,6-dideoxy-N-acetyl-beta-L-altrosamine transaminase [Patescibacteria group bacterium]